MGPRGQGDLSDVTGSVPGPAYPRRLHGMGGVLGDDRFMGPWPEEGRPGSDVPEPYLPYPRPRPDEGVLGAPSFEVPHFRSRGLPWSRPEAAFVPIAGPPGRLDIPKEAGGGHGRGRPRVRDPGHCPCLRDGGGRGQKGLRRQEGKGLANPASLRAGLPAGRRTASNETHQRGRRLCGVAARRLAAIWGSVA